jgi:hypothetical protein
MSKRQYLACNKNWDLITCVKAVSASGATIKQMLILPGKVHLERFYYNLQRDIFIGILESSYLNDKLALKYIYYFNRQSRKS